MAPYPLIASLRTALDQPVFPGKVVVWLLIMLSIIAWVMILSKLIHLQKGRVADRRFTDRLRKSKTTLEAFEEGWDDARSHKCLIYQTGARETAYHLLGSRNPPERLQQRLRQAGKLGAKPLEFVRNAFASGCAAGSASLQGGIEGLWLIGVASLFLGAFGFVWTLMRGFDTSRDFAELAPIVSGSLGFLAIGLIVATPAILARIFLKAQVRTRENELERFRDDIFRLFERSFASPVEPTRSFLPEVEPHVPTREHHSDPATKGEGEVAEKPVPATEGRKRFHSIRERLLRAESEEDLSDPFEVNPIARQAAAASRVGARA